MNYIKGIFLILLLLPFLSFSFVINNSSAENIFLFDPLDVDKNKFDIFNYHQQIIGYDCQHPKGIGSLNLLNVEDCNIPKEYISSTRVKIKVLQRSKYQRVTVNQCLIKVYKRTFYCNASSSSPVTHVPNSDYSYIHSVTKEECDLLHKGEDIQFMPNVYISGRINQTLKHFKILAGGFLTNDSCHGDDNSDTAGNDHNTNIAVQAVITVFLKSISVNVNLNSKKIIFPSGQKCEFFYKSCIDNFNGNSFWNTLTINDKEYKQWNILMDIEAEQLETDQMTFYKIDEYVKPFVIIATNTYSVNGTYIQETEHPRLLIWKNAKNENIPKYINEIFYTDLLSYANAKFLYFDFDMKNELMDLYYDIMKKKCEIKKTILEDMLILASVSPDMFALRIKNSLGFTANTAGEVIYVAECVPIPVSFRKTNTCFLELPVQTANKNTYLNPITHILNPYGTQIPCSFGIGTMFKWNNNVWYKNNILLKEDNFDINILQPYTELNSTYVKVIDYEVLINNTDGTNNTENLNKFTDRIIRDQIYPSIFNEMFKVITGIGTYDKRIDSFKFLDENNLSVSNYLWTILIRYSLNYGEIFNILLGLIFIIYLTKLFIQAIINGIKTKTISGFFKSIMQLFLSPIIITLKSLVILDDYDN